MKKLTTIIISLLLMQGMQNVRAQNWSITGNAGTDPAVNFIGTTDNKNLKIRTNNVIRINMTNSGKVAIGNFTPVFKLDVKGGSINTDSVYRIGGNTVLSIKGTGNTFVGNNSGFSNTTGFGNTANGYRALYSNTTGYANTANGYQALYSNTTGYTNTANGSNALFANTTGNNNTANGFDALLNNTTGFQNTAFGSNSIIINQIGSYNTALGFNTGPNSNSYVNTTCIGIDATATGSNMVRIGNTFVLSIGGYKNWTNISDGRFKENVNENVPGLTFITQLHPVTYRLNREKINDFTGVNERRNKIRDKQQRGDDFLSGDKYSEVTTGFIAQEVEKVAKEIGYDFSGVDAPKNDKDLYGLRYAEFVVPLVKAVQEQQQIIENQQKQIDELKSMMQQLTVNDKKESVTLSKTASLEQNNPNPFSQNSVIKLYLPESTLSASLKIYALNGIELKSFDIRQRGFSEIIINANSFTAGVYVYTLIADEKTVVTKQMIITNE